MPNSKVSKGMMAMLGGILFLLAIVFRPSHQESLQRASPDQPLSQRPSSTFQPLHVSSGAASEDKSEESTGVDFDWRQTLATELTPPILPREEVEKYLQRNGRSAESLLTASRALKDTNYLAKAALNFPNDARIQLAVLDRNFFPEDRRKWLDLFKASSPDNSLANYLSARDYFKNGQKDLAVNELLDAGGKPAFENYALESKLNEEELNMAAGRSSIQARVSAGTWAEDLLPELASFKALAQNVRDLQKQYSHAGDSISARTATQIGLTLANRLQTGEGSRFMINQQVGWAIESMTLGSLDSGESYEFLDGKTPKDRLAEIKKQRESLRTLRQNFRDSLAGMTEAELLSYTERQRLYGEMPAMRWLQQRTSANPSFGGTQ